jgi:hypothetical protein
MRYMPSYPRRDDNPPIRQTIPQLLQNKALGNLEADLLLKHAPFSPPGPTRRFQVRSIQHQGESGNEHLQRC